jgi:uncharacterized tellurite resistance protein B-like protein
MYNKMPAFAQMQLLISLARIDGKVADREKNYIINIGRANGIYPDEILPLFDQQDQINADGIPTDLTDQQKFNYIVSLVQLMKIDERMYKEEIQYCSRIAQSLGYDPQVMFELMLHVKAVPMSDDELKTLRQLTEKYLHKS